VRNKSARAIENEQTESLIKAARGKRGEKEKPAVEQKDKGKEKEKEKEEKEEVKDEGDGAEEGAKDGEGSGKLEPGPEEDTEDTKDTTATKGTKRTRAPPKKRKSKYCLCREEGEGPMIECAGCGNWFHFKCIDLPEAEAERIRAYSGARAEQQSGNLQHVRQHTDAADKYVCAECAQKTGDKTECKCHATAHMQPMQHIQRDIKNSFPTGRQCPNSSFPIVVDSDAMSRLELSPLHLGPSVRNWVQAGGAWQGR